MDWFRLWSEARNDAKLRTLTDAQFRVWFNLLCLVSDEEERGSVMTEDREILAIEVAGGDGELLAETIARLVKLRIVTDVAGRLTFIHFAERQYSKPSDRPERIHERVTRHRERQRNAEPGASLEVKRGETPSGALHGVSVTPRTDTEQIQSRTDPEQPFIATRARASGSKTLPIIPRPQPLEDDWRLAAVQAVGREVLTAKEVAGLLEAQSARHTLAQLHWALSRAKERAKHPQAVINFALTLIHEAPEVPLYGGDERAADPIPAYIQRAIDEGTPLRTRPDPRDARAMERFRAGRAAARAAAQRDKPD